jgi:DNA-binding XRE family transcriptional regulator
MARDSINGVRVKELRDKCGLTQDELAQAVGVSKRTIENAESGTASPHTRFLLAEYFGVAVDELLPPEPQDWTYPLPTPLPSESSCGRREELMKLDDAWEADTCRVVTVVGGWGMGKSALVNEWLKQMEKDNYRGANWVVGWSFRGQGSREHGAGDSFFHYALTCFKDRNPDFGLEQEKATRLIERIGNHRTLLVLDGLEPLQRPPTLREEGGQITKANEALRRLIRHLATHLNGLCVITSHFPVQDLKDLMCDGRAREICLCGLDRQAAVELLRKRNLQGSDQQLNEAVQEYNTHPLSLDVLAGVVHRRYDGNIARWREVAGSSETIAETLDPLMAHLSCEEKAVMKIVGLFDGPAIAEAVHAVRAGDPIPGLTDALKGPGEDGWVAVLKNLRDLHLLEGENKQRQRDLDCHPEVRAYFANRLQRDERDAWREGHLRLYRHFKKAENLKEENPGAVDNLYLAIHHGCKAGLHAQVFDELVWHEMSAEFALRRLNGHGAAARDEMILKYFIPDPFNSEPQCDKEGFDGERRARLFLWAAVVLHVRGRVQAAVKFAEHARQLFEKTEERLSFWFSSAYLSWFLAASGDLDSAFKHSESCVRGVERELRDEPFWTFWKKIALCLHACMVSYRGEFHEALKLYKQAMAEKCDGTPYGFDVVLAILRFHYACLLLQLKSYKDAEREGWELVDKGQGSPVLGFLGYQVLSRMELAKAWERIAEKPRGKREKPALAEVKKHLNQGKDYLNLGPAHDQIIISELFMAQFDRVREKYKDADNHLKRAEKAVESFALLEVDCLLERAKLFLAQGDKENAREKCKTARRRVNDYGYRCIDKQLSDLENEL